MRTKKCWVNDKVASTNHLRSPHGNIAEFKKVVELMQEGKLKPVIDKIFSLKDAATAQKRMEEGKHTGKIVLEIS